MGQDNTPIVSTESIIDPTAVLRITHFNDAFEPTTNETATTIEANPVNVTSKQCP
jgi:hypothetical protein